ATETGNDPVTTESVAATPETSPSSMPNAEKIMPPDSNYRFIVSFISIGEGTDPKALDVMNRILNSWETKTGKPIEKETTPWGREGEVDYCFPLTELNATEQVAFIDEFKSVFEGKTLVQLTENQPCKYKR
ncbi:MAG: hypothetical protein M3Q95_13265, partial [Bacteroidota bacterium]|nr:hypothetical protein [Bacteroidota bacterium]